MDGHRVVYVARISACESGRYRGFVLARQIEDQLVAGFQSLHGQR